VHGPCAGIILARVPGGSDRVGYEYLPVAGRGTEEPHPRVRMHTQC